MLILNPVYIFAMVPIFEFLSKEIITRSEKQIRNGKRDQKYNLISYDMILDNQLSLLKTFVLKEDATLDSILLKDDYMKVIDIINRLDYKDKNLIIELLFRDKKEKELAQKYQIA